MNSNKRVYYVFTQHMEERAGVAVEKVAGKSTEKAAKQAYQMEMRWNNCSLRRFAISNT